MKWRVLALPLPGCVLVTVIWRSGYTAPLIYGAKLWWSARPWQAEEPDPVC